MTSREFSLTLTESDRHVRLPPRLRERYLTPTVDETVVQAVGDTLRLWLWSDNQDIRVDIPLSEWCAERPFRRSIHRWGVNLNRWGDVLACDDSGDTRTVPATVTPTDTSGPIR